MTEIYYAHSDRFEIDLSIDLNQGQCIGIHGNTGSGKTTLLKCISGLLIPKKGRVLFKNDVWFDHAEGINVDIQQRKVGIVFQGHSLFPNLSVIENLRYGLNSLINLDQLIERFDLNALLNMKPKSLSGGQTQRVAIARAIASAPQLLMLDEPFSAQDENSRSALYELIKLYQRELGFKTIIISHYPNDLISICDFLIRLEQGKISYQGSPIEYFNKTIVNASFVEGKIVSINNHLLTVKSKSGYLTVPVDQAEKFSIGQTVKLKGEFKIEPG